MNDQDIHDELVNILRQSGDKLDPDFKAEWLTALRSGEYQKTTVTLYSPRTNAYCCLGVACDLLGFKKNNDNRFDDAAVVAIYPAKSEKSVIGLSEEVTTALYSLNDGVYGCDTDFERMANIIEENL